MKSVSVVVPVYNEEDLISDTTQQIIDFFSARTDSYELVLVNDGSTDNTKSVLTTLCSQHDCVRVLSYQENRGKGFAIRTGVLASTHEVVVFMDADLSTPLAEFDRLAKYLNSYDVVIGSRATADADVSTRWHKQVLGRISNAVISLVVSGISDTQCGFKLFDARVAKRVCAQQTVYGWGFDFELLFLAQKYGYNIKEVGVRWVEDTNSAVSFLDYPKTFLELLRIRYNELRGVYE